VRSTARKLERRAAAEEQRGAGALESEEARITREITALNGEVIVTTLSPPAEVQRNILAFFKSMERSISEILLNKLENFTGVKWYMTVHLIMSRINERNEIVRISPFVRCLPQALIHSDQIEQQMAECFKQLYTSIEDFNEEGSGWVLESIEHLEVNIVPYKPLMGGERKGAKILPEWIVRKKAVLNITSFLGGIEDVYCFAYSMLAHKFPRVRPRGRAESYAKYWSAYDWSMISFPTSLKQIKKFETANNIAINVLGLEGDVIFPIQVSEHRRQSIDRVNLLMTQSGNNAHFCLITNISRLIAGRTRRTNAHFICDYCCHPFTARSALISHQELCQTQKPQRIEMPKPGSYLEFNRYDSMLKMPFVIYADFESILVPISGCAPNPENSFTVRTAEHVACGFSLYPVSSRPDLFSFEPVLYRGKNAARQFLIELTRLEKSMVDIMRKVVPKRHCVEASRDFALATHCHLCKKPLNGDKVYNHCHLSGDYFGASHRDCNLKFKFVKRDQKKKDSYSIPCIMHNMRSYDTHLIMQEIGKDKKYRKLGCIANTAEKYITFHWGNIRFIDSAQFLNKSLAALVQDLLSEGTQAFQHLERFCPDNETFKLMLGKCPYPYEYMDCMERFEETQLPPKEKFYSDLTRTSISEEDYELVQKIWKQLKIESMGDFHDCYVILDTLLLACVFEKHREMCLVNYEIDPVHYITLPSFSFQAMLKMTGVRMELLTCPDMYLFLESGIRGGISVISHRYCKANNPSVADYDPSKPTSYLFYTDANGLYADTMRNPLPLNNFRWLEKDEIDALNPMLIDDNGDNGYILEVDLLYPQELHDRDNDYPLAPERLTLTETQLSPLSQEMRKILNIKSKIGTKLSPNLKNKTKYVVHYRNLKFYLERGMILTKVHRVMTFHQEPFLKPYIDFNTNKRALATSDSQKNLFKIAINSIYGKTIENLRLHKNVRLITDKKPLIRAAAKTTFLSFKIFHENLIAINQRKVKITLNKPIAIGFSVLDISKLIMYNFHYRVMMPYYTQERMRLCFTDTDSFLYEIITKDLYADIANKIELFDTSNYPRDHPLFSMIRNKRLGCFKDETGGVPIQEWCGLRAKMYSFITSTLHEHKRAKGIKKCIVEKELRHQNYINALKAENGTIKTSQTGFRSYGHRIYTTQQRKTALSGYDDKRWIEPCGIKTRAHFHYLNEQKEK